MIHFVGTNQAGKRLMMQCLQNCSGATILYIGRAVDIQLVFGMMVPIIVKKKINVCSKRLDGSRDCYVFELKG